MSACLSVSVCVPVSVYVWGGDVQLCMDGADKNTRAERALHQSVCECALQLREQDKSCMSGGVREETS